MGTTGICHALMASDRIGGMSPEGRLSPLTPAACVDSGQRLPTERAGGSTLRTFARAVWPLGQMTVY